MKKNKKKLLKQLIEKAEDMPPLPKVAHRALRLLSKSNFNMQELASILSTDQALTGQLLHWANSSYYGLRNPVSTINQAVVYLGEMTVRSLVLTASLANYMYRSVPGYHLDRGELWKHSLGIAVSAKLVSKRFGENISEESYTAGLLCDIGKLVFDVALRDFKPTDPEWQKRPFSELETNHFGINHAVLGARIGKHWGFPPELLEAISHHHHPSKADKDAISPSAVHVGDVLVSILGIGIGRDGLQYKLDKFALKRLGIEETDFEDLLLQVTALIKDVETIINP